ncbi:MAG TPA: hypothetical protein ENI62_11020 [Gammaproteobacteria bacterium]|nr:hypothetical protein [Gammaproteobacteria bacterium]
MISDEDVKQLFLNGRNFLVNNNSGDALLTQFYRGAIPDNWENQPKGACNRHMALFNKFAIIPKYCFSCYKVIIEPRTVLELFKLMMVFEKHQMPNDNTRKCLVEGRPRIAGTYKGIIYCRSKEEGEEISRMMRRILPEEISSMIPVVLKRGCSEYAQAFPEYAKIDQEAKLMEYKNEWIQIEDLADKNALVNRVPRAHDTHNRDSYTREDYRVMVAWLKYAATIGDKSYLSISGVAMQPFQGLKRPTQFRAVGDD